jgi:hypothetical protein
MPGAKIGQIAPVAFCFLDNDIFDFEKNQSIIRWQIQPTTNQGRVLIWDWGFTPGKTLQAPTFQKTVFGSVFLKSK